VFVVTELVSKVSEKVTETVDVIETDVSPSEGELDDTVGDVSLLVLVSVEELVVLSVLVEPSSLPQEIMVRLNRNMEKMTSICLIRFPNWLL